ncbi:MAG: hypothetical protein ACR2QE_02895 [Acidimicrobiales bacterium]
MRPGPDNRWFFVHVMKTGGTTVQTLFTKYHDRRNVYPCQLDEPMFNAKMNPRFLRQLSAERLAEIHVFSAHMPAATTETLPYPTRTLTVLREPIARTVSWLRQNQRIHSPEASLEQIYDVEAARRAYADNHQTRMFAIRPSDDVNSFTNYIEIDETRLAEAQQRLDNTDMVGFQDDLGRFMAAVADRFDYPESVVPNRNVATGDYQVSDALVARIEEDNAADLEFYQYARTTRFESL